MRHVQGGLYQPDEGVHGSYTLEETGNRAICIYCGQCANVCPVDSIVERDECPQVRQAAADLTIVEEASELIRRITEKDRLLPQFTSCCPGWVHFAEMYAPELLPHLSTAKSPIGMQGPTVKTYFAKKMGLDPEKIVHVALTPCTAKKFEIRRGELHGAADHLGIPGLRDTDQVITTRELARWTKAEGVDWNALEDSAYDSLMGQASGAGVIFGNTGGVMEPCAPPMPISPVKAPPRAC